MKTKNIVICVVIILAAVLVFYAANGYKLPFGNSNIVAVYTNPNNGASINVTYDNGAKTATLESQSFHGVVFTQTVSADGARYENTEKSLVLWNKGNDIILTQNGSSLFMGSTVTK